MIVFVAVEGDDRIAGRSIPGLIFPRDKKVNRRAQDVSNEIAIAAQRRPFAGPATPGNHCNRDSFVKRIWKENLGRTAEGRRGSKGGGRGRPIVPRRPR